MKIKFIAAVAALALLAGACATAVADMSNEELRDTLVEVLTEGDALDSETAVCVVDEMFANTSRSELNRIASAEDVTDMSQEEQDVVTDAVIACL